MILLAAFKPFGPKRFLTGTNASAELLALLLEQQSGRFGSVLMDVGPPALEQFRHALAERRWSGVFVMGESGMIASSHLVLEPEANVIEHATSRPVLPFDRTVTSAFAARAQAAKRGSSASMGAFWCNRVHLEALTWSENNGGVPVAFVHVPAVFGTSVPGYGWHVKQLFLRYADEASALLAQMPS